MSLGSQLRNQLIVSGLSTALEIVKGLIERNTGTAPSEEEVRAALLELADNPPKKADFGPAWDELVARLKGEGEVN